MSTAQLETNLFWYFFNCFLFYFHDFLGFIQQKSFKLFLVGKTKNFYNFFPVLDYFDNIKSIQLLSHDLSQPLKTLLICAYCFSDQSQDFGNDF